ncbi:MAG: ABC transporter ATP-binding protein [Gammaproteobacteria bacterium]|nr:ABC transporter ATP-binding protein [Gammaproteobacteria bacterium]
MTRGQADAPAIQIETLGKRYFVNSAHFAGHSFREMLMETLRAPVKRYKTLAGNVDEKDTFWALKNVSFNVGRGEVVGVIGRNGAGKSTLLKVLTRITPPTEGRARIYGKVSSLLEIGTGFHPELSGRDNVFLNGAILGMSRPEISRKFDAIVDFAEVGQFIDTPVKRYSSGMHVRLAFSIAAHLDPDVLLVDEVLAVGDKRFQTRSIGKLQDVARGGRTVLYVSHNMGSVMDLCDRCIVLDGGQLIFDGPAEAAIRRYLEMMSEPERGLHEGMFKGPLTDRVFFKELKINGKVVNGNMVVSPSQEICIECRGESRVELADFNIFTSIFKDGVRLLSMQDSPEGTVLRTGNFTSVMELSAYFLRPGTYTVGIGGERKGQYQWLWGVDVAQFTVLEQWQEGYEERDYGPINYAPHGNRTQ